MAVARENAQHDILQKSYQRPDPVRGDQRRQLGLLWQKTLSLDSSVLQSNRISLLNNSSIYK
jgi:hypothetical protein